MEFKTNLGYIARLCLKTKRETRNGEWKRRDRVAYTDRERERWGRKEGEIGKERGKGGRVGREGGESENGSLEACS